MMRISFDRRKNITRQLSELPHWLLTAWLDDEMRRQLNLKDKPKGDKDYGMQNSGS